MYEAHTCNACMYERGERARATKRERRQRERARERETERETEREKEKQRERERERERERDRKMCGTLDVGPRSDLDGVDIGSQDTAEEHGGVVAQLYVA